MTFVISGFVLFGILLFLAIRYANLSMVLALVAVLFGYFLAESSNRASVDHLLTSIVGYVSGHHGK